MKVARLANAWYSPEVQFWYLYSSTIGASMYCALEPEGRSQLIVATNSLLKILFSCNLS